MSREDWAAFEEIKRERSNRREKHRNSFADKYSRGALSRLWIRHCETHYSYQLLGCKLEYWPGPKKWRWQGKTMTGDVFEFIQARESRGA